MKKVSAKTKKCLKDEHIDTVEEVCAITNEQLDPICKLGERNEIRNIQHNLLECKTAHAKGFCEDTGLEILSVLSEHHNETASEY